MPPLHPILSSSSSPSIGCQARGARGTLRRCARRRLGRLSAPSRRSFFFRPPTHFSHMSHPTFPISQILILQTMDGWALRRSAPPSARSQCSRSHSGCAPARSPFPSSRSCPRGTTLGGVTLERASAGGVLGGAVMAATQALSRRCAIRRPSPSCGAGLGRASWPLQDLRQAELRRAKLRRAELRRVQLRVAQLRVAELRQRLSQGVVCSQRLA